MAGSFEEIARFVADGILVQKIKSKNTGLTIIKADVEGPVVQGYFTLATEAHDHDGCPHTLEHLVFMGSELYPFKGVLDRVANRNFADGTNAWTATDHTAYTLKTAGSEGFLNILPVYLDHILYPTLTDSACYTEVQHINGEGSNSGVVYCEMQAVENTRRNIVNKKLMDFLYPGNSGYKSETGGRLLNLRSLTVDTIRKYHQDYYRVDNLVIIITGKLKDEELFKALAPVEQRILSKQSLPPIVRPWTSPENIQSFTKSITEEVPFPSEDLSVGSATFGWRGPEYVDFATHGAINVLLEYLTDSPVSPLTALMCEIDSPYGSSFSYYVNLYLSTSVRLSLSDVPVEKLTQVQDFLFATLKEIFDKQDIDMNRMSAVISRTKLKYLEALENNPHETICDQVITDFLYATSPAHLKDLFAVAPRLDNFLKEDKSFWLNILKKYILDAPCACVLGRPSVELSKKLVEEEEKRIEQQKKDLGETKMKDLAEKLVTAMDTNNTPAPNSLYASQPVPSASNISLVAVDTVQNDTVVSQNGQPVLDKILSESKDKADFFLQFDHIKSSFVAITVLLSTVHVPDDLRLYLELFRELFFKNPVMKGGEQVSSDDVVKGLTEDTIEYSNSLGFGSSSSFSCGTYAQYLNLHVKLETGKYTKVIDWCKLLLWQSVFTAEKIKVAATKLLSEIPKYKLDGFGVARSVLQEVNFMKSSNYKTSNFVRQTQFLNQVIKKLEENPKSVVDDIQNLRSLLTIPSAITVHVAANILNLTPVKTPWLSFLPSSTSAASPAIAPPTVPQHSLKYLAHKEGQGHIIAVPGLESSFLVQTSDTTIASVALSFASPPEDIAAVMVASTYFTMMEGPFWRSIRGGGLAYSFNITPRLEESLVLFYLYRSANLVKAYETAKNIISELIEGKENFDEMSLVEARSSCVHEIVEKAITVGDAARESLLDHMRQWKRNGYSEVLKHIQTVSVDQLREALNKYIKPLFDAKHSNVVVTTSGGKTDDILKGLSPSGLSLSLIENQESFHSI